MRDLRMMCGSDLRRVAMGPEDEARAEAFVAQHVGVMDTFAVGHAAVAVQWTAANGHVLTTTGTTAAEALSLLSHTTRG
jgi:hypothetical protein